MKRRCGWIQAAQETPARVVWARNGAATTVCPKSMINPQSMEWIEAYLARRRFGETGAEGMHARQVEAFLILDRELGVASAGPNSGQRSGRAQQVQDA